MYGPMTRNMPAAYSSLGSVGYMCLSCFPWTLHCDLALRDCLASWGHPLPHDTTPNIEVQSQTLTITNVVCLA